MLILTGEYELTLDEKNRMLVPSRLREQIPTEQIDTGFYLTVGVNWILSLYPDRYYQRIALAVAPGKAAPDESLVFERINYALAGRVELDRQGRVLLPEKAIRRAGLKERVTLIGVRDHLELWDRQKWERYMQEHLAGHEQMLLMVRQEAMQRDRTEALQQGREEALQQSREEIRKKQ
ncbi:division/cell wall cluster transcriptional repressor MraZ [Planctomycetota bacterium]